MSQPGVNTAEGGISVALQRWRKNLLVFFRMVKIEHSVFALPFAYIGMLWAARGWPGWRVFLLVTVAMVSVRTFAMAFNRWADLPFDRVNPRTLTRPLVSGEISERTTLILTAASAAIFVLAAAGIGKLVLQLSPVALVLAAGYSYTKRGTWLCHFWLGSVLGLAPVAGWLAVTGAFHLAPVLLGLGVTFWVAGFDILYAMQDVEFDRNAGLYSMPARFGLETSLALSSFAHADTAIFFLLAGWAAGAGLAYFLCVAGLALLLAYEHAIIHPGDLSRVNTAFFTVNGIVAVSLLAGVLLDLWLRLGQAG